MMESWRQSRLAFVVVWKDAPHTYDIDHQHHRAETTFTNLAFFLFPSVFLGGILLGFAGLCFFLLLDIDS